LTAGAFRVELDKHVLADVFDVTFDPLEVEAIEDGEAVPREFRAYRPGTVSIGRLRVRVTHGADSRLLYEWWAAASEGQNIRKSISVICLKRDGGEARRFTALGAYPIRWDAGDYSPGSDLILESFTLGTEHIAFS
jgi:hypothetical protein